MALFGTSCVEQRSVRDEFSGLTRVSKSDTTQNLERQRVDGNEQRLHRTFGHLILANPAQQQIHTRPSKAQNFSFAVARHEGSVNSIADLSEVRYTEKRYRSVRPRKILDQLYPTRRKPVWSKLLSLKDAGPGNFTLAQSKSTKP
jgi:hypothetical protein